MEQYINNEKLFHDNEKLIYFTLNKYYKGYRDIWEDLYQVGALTLWKLMGRYNEDKGTFSTYAVNGMRKEIWKYIIGERQGQKYKSSLYYIDKYINENKNNMSQSELYKKCKEQWKISVDLFNMLYYKMSTSLDEFIESGLDVSDRSNIEEIVEGKDEWIWDIVEEVIKDESERDGEIYKEWLKSKYKVDGKASTGEISKKYNISRQRISQIADRINRRVQRLIKIRTR